MKMETSNDNNKVESNYYNYKALETLHMNIDEYLSKNIISKIEICGFEIDNSGREPFIKYLMAKDLLFDIMYFPLETLDFKDLLSESLIIYTKIKLYGLLNLTDYNDYDNNIKFKGFYILNDTVKIFYDLTECKLQLNDVYKSSSFWFCLIDEIINYNNILNFIFEESITDFFKNNIEFCFLYDRNNVKYEVPSLAYVGRNGNSMLNFTYVFGVSPKDKNCILGPYYYFTNYQNSVKEGFSSVDLKSETEKCKNVTENIGVVRFALFLGKMKIIENFQNDENDISDIKQERLNDSSLNKNIEMLTMRISDHDGKWSENYDSACISNLELDNGERLENTPIVIVKNYNQQIPLSYHYIHKRTHNEKYDMDRCYSIL